MTVTVPPHPETEHGRDLEQRVAALEALIEEARRRARRRRSVYAAAALVLIAIGLAASFRNGGGGGATLGSPAAEGSSRSPATPGEAVLAPPLCANAGSASVLAGWLPGHRLAMVQAPVKEAGMGRAVYTRWCGPATILARLHGTTYRIRGGRCESTAGYLVRAGLFARAAARGRWVGIVLHDARAQHPGTFTLPGRSGDTRYASAELRGRTFQTISHGTVTIGRSLRDGTFVLRLADGTPLTGSWTCG